MQRLKEVSMAGKSVRNQFSGKVAMKPKILLVDDEPNIIHSYSRGLRKEWDLVTALSGEEGLAAILRAVKNLGKTAGILEKSIARFKL